MSDVRRICNKVEDFCKLGKEPCEHSYPHEPVKNNLGSDCFLPECRMMKKTGVKCIPVDSIEARSLT